MANSTTITGPLRDELQEFANARGNQERRDIGPFTSLSKTEARNLLEGKPRNFSPRWEAVRQGLGTAKAEEHDKVRENRLRRMAERQDLRLERSRRRDPRAVDYGTYHLIDVRTNAVVVSGLNSGYGLDLDAVEHALSSDVGGALQRRVAHETATRLTEHQHVLDSDMSPDEKKAALVDLLTPKRARR